MPLLSAYKDDTKMKPEYAGHGCADGEGKDVCMIKERTIFPLPKPEPEENQGGCLDMAMPVMRGEIECVDDRDNDKVACVSFGSSSRICQKDSTRAEQKSPYLVRDCQYHCAIAPFS